MGLGSTSSLGSPKFMLPFLLCPGRKYIPLKEFNLEHFGGKVLRGMGRQEERVSPTPRTASVWRGAVTLIGESLLLPGLQGAERGQREQAPSLSTHPRISWGACDLQNPLGGWRARVTSRWSPRTGKSPTSQHRVGVQSECPWGTRGSLTL